MKIVGEGSTPLSQRKGRLREGKEEGRWGFRLGRSQDAGKAEAGDKEGEALEGKQGRRRERRSSLLSGVAELPDQDPNQHL